MTSKKRRGNLLKNRKQQIVAIAILILYVVSAALIVHSFFESSAMAMRAEPPEVCTVPPTQIIIQEETTKCQETKINYSDTIQVLVTPELRQHIEYLVSNYEEEIEMATKVMIVEAGGVPSDAHRAAVVWCILNRADASAHKDIKKIITAPNQFAWYSGTSYTQEQYRFVKDIFIRWLLEKEGIDEVGRVLPSEYRWFRGDGRENYFRNAYQGNYTVWDWSLADPYIE